MTDSIQWTRPLTDNLYPSSKRGDGKTGQLEMLQPPRDSDNGNKQQESEYHVCQCNPEPCDDKPYDIQQGKKATRQGSLLNLKGSSEGPEAQRPYLDELKTEWDPDDGSHHDQSPQEIADGGGQPTKQQPDQVPEKVQGSASWMG